MTGLDDELIGFDAQVVYESAARYDLQSGPIGYSRVGFRIGNRIWWAGMCGAYVDGASYKSAELLCREVVRRWNADTQARTRARPEKG